MRLFMGSGPSSWCTAAFVLMVGVAMPAVGQKSNQSKTQAVLAGRVVNTAGAPIADAEVVIASARDTSVSHRGVSNARGEVVIGGLPAGGPYTLLARKIGFGSARGTDVHLKAGDTLRVDFELPASGVTLPTLTARSHRGSRTMIGADEIDSRKYPNALNVLAWKRQYMLGDPDRCSAPMPPPWAVPQNKGIGRRPWVNGARFFDVFNPPYSPYVQRVYVNGYRVDRPGESPLVALNDIPSEQIAEMRYVDCADMTDAWPYSIYIVLKSPSREVQDSIFRSIPGLKGIIEANRPSEP